MKVWLRRRQVTIVAESDGYHPAEKTLHVSDETGEITLTLQAKPASYTVVIQPENARLSLTNHGAKITGSGKERTVEFNAPDGQTALTDWWLLWKVTPTLSAS